MSFLSKCSIVATLFPLFVPFSFAAPFRPGVRFLVAQADVSPPAAAPEPTVKQTHKQKIVKPKVDKVAPAARALVAPAPSAAAAQAPVAAQSSSQAPAAAPTAPLTVSQKLVEVGAPCTGHVEAIAREALVGTKTYVPESFWRPTDASKHMVGVIIGQSFGDGAKIPHGFTGIVAAPGAAGTRCDAYTFQVLPSPLPCKEIQANLEKNGKPAIDLAGLPVLHNNVGQIALLPGATGAGCIVVGFHPEY